MRKKYNVEAEIKRLNEKLAHALEWYSECIDCEETRTNISRELESIMKEERRTYPMLNDYTLRIEGGVGETIVVRAVKMDLTKN